MIDEISFKNEVVIDIAKKMAVAVRTAPKGRGKDTLEIKIASANDLELLAKKMNEIAEEYDLQNLFARDAENIRNASAVLLIGTKISPLGLTVCGLCGMQSCEKKNLYPEIPCVFNTNDLGIAIGSAAGIAIDNRVDSRVMYTVGMAAKTLGIFSEDVKIVLGIALSATSKNIFFDRK